MNVSVERAQGHQNAIYSIKICAKAKTELADISQNCFHEARIVLLQTELFSKIHLSKDLIEQSGGQATLSYLFKIFKDAAWNIT